VITIEKLLSRLFDFQRFEKNKDLQRIINEVEDSYERTFLADSELSLVAGGKEIQEDKKEDKSDTELQ